MIKEVMLLFKTHLDIGYTDLASKVKRKYIDTYIPSAIKLGYELRDSDTPFVWTTGSWIIYEALKSDDGTLARAIEDGLISWHALPFTSHTESMSEKLFEHGLSLSEELDARFHRKTIGAKMTDVPGHTSAMIPALKRHGVEFLHIGINSATPPPDVPPICKYRYGDDEITLISGTGYGKGLEIGDRVLYFAHTGDNLGPQNADAVRAVYREIAELYPGAKITACDLNYVAEKLRDLKGLPVVDKEIGDTWIHGIATDPKKLSEYRALLRHFENMKERYDLCDSLLLVPEHTWGLNVQLNYVDHDDWFTDGAMRCEGSSTRMYMESSWVEQREYVARAQAQLGVESDYDTSDPSLEGFEPFCGEPSVAEISWTLYDERDNERVRRKFLRDTIPWMLWDYTKCELPEYEGGTFTAKTTAAYRKGDTRIYKMSFPEKESALFGLPWLWLIEDGEYVTLKWKDKKPTRVPQACFIKFLGMKEKWELDKMGKWIPVSNIMYSKLESGVLSGVRNEDVFIESLDAGLVLPYGRRLYDFDLSPKGQDLYFCLYNNQWNTNFPLWYKDDAVFRFIIHRR